MNRHAARRSTTEVKSSVEPEAGDEGSLKLDAPIAPPGSPGTGLNRALTIRQKIARWLEEKL